MFRSRLFVYAGMVHYPVSPCQTARKPDMQAELSVFGCSCVWQGEECFHESSDHEVGPKPGKSCVFAQCSFLLQVPSVTNLSSAISTFQTPLLVVFSDVPTCQVKSDVVAQSLTMETQRLSRISKLASIVAANTAIYDKCISSQGLPSPSFDIKHPIQLSGYDTDTTKTTRA